eukprot:6492173-Amphidinium_carterae.2
MKGSALQLFNWEVESIIMNLVPRLVLCCVGCKVEDCVNSVVKNSPTRSSPNQNTRNGEKSTMSQRHDVVEVDDTSSRSRKLAGRCCGNRSVVGRLGGASS